MNKAELIDLVAQRLELSRKAASDAVEAVVDSIKESVSSGERVAITGFGVFERVERAARTGRNPLTGVSAPIKATSVPKFRPGAEFKAVVAGQREAAKAHVAAAKKAVTKVVAKAAPAKAAPAKAAPAKAAPAKAAPAKKAAAKKVAKAAPAKAAPAKAAPTKKAAAKKVAKKAPAKTAKRTTAS